MKLYLTLALIALLFNFGATKHVPRNLKTASSEDVVTQELSSETDLDDNVVDNENSVSNTVNLLETPQPAAEVTLVENAPTKTVSTVSNARLVSSQPATLVSKTLVSPVQTVPLQTVSVQTAPLQTLNVVKSQSNLVRTQTPTSKTVVVNQPAQLVYSQPQQQQQYTRYYWTQQPQTQYVYSAPQQQQTQYVYSTPQQQTQYVYSAPQQQQVVYSQVPQQQVVSVAQQPQQLVTVNSQQPQQQVVSVAQQPQQQVVSVAQQQPQLVSATPSNSEKLVVLNRSRQNNVARNNVLLLQQQPAQLSTLKTVTTKVSNPVVYQLTPSRTASLNTLNSRQTVLSGSQLVADVADNESRATASDSVVVQESESY